jgi:hypothetical protein
MEARETFEGSRTLHVPLILPPFETMMHFLFIIGPARVYLHICIHRIRSDSTSQFLEIVYANKCPQATAIMGGSIVAKYYNQRKSLANKLVWCTARSRF